MSLYDKNAEVLIKNNSVKKSVKLYDGCSAFSGTSLRMLARRCVRVDPAGCSCSSAVVFRLRSAGRGGSTRAATRWKAPTDPRRRGQTTGHLCGSLKTRARARSRCLCTRGHTRAARAPPTPPPTHTLSPFFRVDLCALRWRTRVCPRGALTPTRARRWPRGAAGRRARCAPDRARRASAALGATRRRGRWTAQPEGRTPRATARAAPRVGCADLPRRRARRGASPETCPRAARSRRPRRRHMQWTMGRKRTPRRPSLTT